MTHRSRNLDIVSAAKIRKQFSYKLRLKCTDAAGHLNI